jgi:hypothetical protein
MKYNFDRIKVLSDEATALNAIVVATLFENGKTIGVKMNCELRCLSSDEIFKVRRELSDAVDVVRKKLVRRRRDAIRRIVNKRER